MNCKFTIIDIFPSLDQIKEPISEELTLKINSQEEYTLSALIENQQELFTQLQIEDSYYFLEFIILKRLSPIAKGKFTIYSYNLQILINENKQTIHWVKLDIINNNFTNCMIHNKSNSMKIINMMNMIKIKIKLSIIPPENMDNNRSISQFNYMMTTNSICLKNKSASNKNLMYIKMVKKSKNNTYNTNKSNVSENSQINMDSSIDKSCFIKTKKLHKKNSSINKNGNSHSNSNINKIKETYDYFNHLSRLKKINCNNNNISTFNHNYYNSNVSENNIKLFKIKNKNKKYNNYISNNSGNEDLLEKRSKINNNFSVNRQNKEINHKKNNYSISNNICLNTQKIMNKKIDISIIKPKNRRANSKLTGSSFISDNNSIFYTNNSRSVSLNNNINLDNKKQITNKINNSKRTKYSKNNSVHDNKGGLSTQGGSYIGDNKQLKKDNKLDYNNNLLSSSNINCSYCINCKDNNLMINDTFLINNSNYNEYDLYNSEEELINFSQFNELKEDFSILYTKEYLDNITDDLLKLEFDFFIGKTFDVFSAYKDQIKLLKDINEQIKKDYNNSYNKFIDLQDKFHLFQLKKEKYINRYENKKYKLNKFYYRKNQFNIFDKILFSKDKFKKEKLIQCLKNIVEKNNYAVHYLNKKHINFINKKFNLRKRNNSNINKISKYNNYSTNNYNKKDELIGNNFNISKYNVDSEIKKKYYKNMFNLNNYKKK